jgi:hypothetical protein
MIHCRRYDDGWSALDTCNAGEINDHYIARVKQAPHPLGNTQPRTVMKRH